MACDCKSVQDTFSSWENATCALECKKKGELFVQTYDSNASGCPIVQNSPYGEHLNLKGDKGKPDQHGPPYLSACYVIQDGKQMCTVTKHHEKVAYLGECPSSVAE